MAEARRPRNTIGSAQTADEARAALAARLGIAAVELGTADSPTTTLELLAGDMVLVDITIGQWIAKNRWTAEEWGIESFSEISDPDAREAIEAVYKYGERYLLPDEVRKRLTRLAMRGRKNVYRNSFETPFGRAIPVTAYADFHEEDERCKAAYIDLVDDVCDNLAVHLEEVTLAYRQQAVIAYRRLVGADINDTGHNPSQGFVVDFVTQILRAVPSPEAIRRKFYWRTTTRMVVLPSMVQAEQERIADLRTAGMHKRDLDEADLQAEVARRAAIADVLRDQAVDDCRKLAEDVTRQFNTHCWSVIEAARKSLETNDGTLVGITSRALRNLVTWAGTMNPTDDVTLLEAFVDLQDRLGTIGGDRQPDEVQAAVKKLSEVTRQNLIAVATADSRHARLIDKETDGGLAAADVQRAVRRRSKRTVEGTVDRLAPTSPRKRRLVG